MWRCLNATGKIPTGRSSHALGAVGNNLFLFGGEHEPRIPLPDDFYTINTQERTWNVIEGTHKPKSLIATTFATIGTKLYLFGGRSGLVMGEGDTNELHCFDTVTSQWNKVEASGDFPAKRSYHAMVACSGKLYVFGGCTAEGRVNDLHAFDPANQTWEKQPGHDAISPRGGPGLVAVKNSVFVIGGFSGEEETNDMYEYNTVTKSWRSLNPEPNIPPTSVFAVSDVGSKVVLFGGEVSPSALGHAGAGGFSNDVYIFDVDAEEKGWVKLEVSGDVPSERGWLVAASAEGNFYIFGGNLKSNERANDLYALTL